MADQTTLLLFRCLQTMGRGCLEISATAGLAGLQFQLLLRRSLQTKDKGDLDILVPADCAGAQTQLLLWKLLVTRQKMSSKAFLHGQVPI